MNLSPRQLRMFLALATSLNFSRTAEQLFMTQPSLSKAIRDMEESMGLALFERTTRSVLLTQAAQHLVPIARSIVGEYEAGMQRMQNWAEVQSHHLSIASLPSLATTLLPRACAALGEKYHRLQLTVHDGSNAMSIQRLVSYQADFSLASAAPSHPDVQYQEILRDRFVLLYSEKWRDKVQPKMSMEALLDLPLISMTDASTAMRYMAAAFLQRGIEFRPQMQFDQVGTIAGFVQEGIGIAVLPYLGMTPLFATRELLLSQIIDGPIRSVGVVTRKTGRPSDLALEAIQRVTEIARELVEKDTEWLLPPSAGSGARGF